ncbi:arabinan endo-1,5-alpha-L-arabinosidase [Cyclobacterium salsum]|uniref:arabinan endo-1,5-alpha-L-arabinosidase n=1 Tax=Cyclobacterium salsum TaxID=2666329 RepID=UPI001F46C5A6|nr:arabinan endo-1,5-alpha-L-arabinosidase [Cyclobacterium salsum]
MNALLKNCFCFFLFVGFHLSGMCQQVPTAELRAHDPVMVEAEGRYYLFTTGRGIAVWSSSDMKCWKKEPPVFSNAPEWVAEVVPGFRNHIWAPDIFAHEGTYYLYYSVSAFGKNTSAIGLATSTSLDPSAPDYGWKDQGLVIRSVPGRDLWNAIDPNLIMDEEGSLWLSFGSFWSGLKIVELEKDFKTVKKEPDSWFSIARRARSFTTEDRTAGAAALEAPFIFKKNGFYYLFVSFDYCCRGENSTYKVMVGRSEDVRGPYLDQNGKRLLEGGGSLVVEGNKNWHGVGHNATYTFDGEDYLIFHGYDASDEGKPKLLIRTLIWTEDGWPEVFL